MSQLPQNNTTLLNIAASDGSTVSGMVMPKFDSGLKNSWRARISASGAMAGLSTLCLPIDALQLPHRIALVKIDAEGHDRAVLKGMAELLKKDRPVVVIESKTAEVSLFLRDLGYALTPEKMYNDLVFCSY
jgi:FkbM family methyltransferase